MIDKFYEEINFKQKYLDDVRKEIRPVETRIQKCLSGIQGCYDCLEIIQNHQAKKSVYYNMSLFDDQEYFSGKIENDTKVKALRQIEELFAEIEKQFRKLQRFVEKIDKGKFDVEEIWGNIPYAQKNRYFQQERDDSENTGSLDDVLKDYFDKLDNFYNNFDQHK